MTKLRVVALRAQPDLSRRNARKFAGMLGDLFDDKTMLLISGVGEILEEILRELPETTFVGGGLVVLCSCEMGIVTRPAGAPEPAPLERYCPLDIYLKPQTWTQWFQGWFRWTPQNAGLLEDPVHNGILRSPKFIDIKVNDRVITFTDVPPSNYLEEQIAFMREIACDVLILHSMWGIREEDAPDLQTHEPLQYPGTLGNIFVDPVECDLADFCTIKPLEGYVTCCAEPSDEERSEGNMSEDEAVPIEAPEEEQQENAGWFFNIWPWSAEDLSKKNR